MRDINTALSSSQAGKDQRQAKHHQKREYRPDPKIRSTITHSHLLLFSACPTTSLTASRRFAALIIGLPITLKSAPSSISCVTVFTRLWSSFVADKPRIPGVTITNPGAATDFLIAAA